MRVTRLVAAAVLAAIALGTGVGHLASTGAGPRRAPVARSNPPLATPTTARSSLVVRIEPVGGEASAPWLRVVVENPNATAVSSLRLAVAVTGGSCAWPEGPFPSPFGLSAGATSQRTCQVQFAPTSGAASVEASVAQGSAVLASTRVEVLPPVADPADPSGGPTTGERPGEAPTDPGPPPPARPPPAVLPPGPGSAPLPPCPQVVGAIPAPSVGLDELGPGMEARSLAVDLDACPSWSPVAGVRAIRHDTGEPCPAWLVWLPGAAQPAVRLSAAQELPCSSVPLQVEVFAQPAAVSAMVVALTAWAVEGDEARAGTIHRAAASGASAGCGGTGSVGVTNPYEQHGAGGVVYRAGLRRC